MILWKRLPGCGTLDFLPLGAEATIGGVRAARWPPHGDGWALIRYLGDGRWEAVSYIALPPTAGMVVTFDGEQWDWENQGPVEPSPIPLADLLAWLKGFRARGGATASSDWIIEQAIEKWGGGPEEGVG